MRHLILEGEPGGLPVTPGPAGPVGESLAEYVDHSLDHDDLSTALPHPQAYREYCAARRKALAARNSGPARPCQTAVDPVGGAFAHRSDQPHQHAVAGQQDPPGRPGMDGQRREPPDRGRSGRLTRCRG